MLKRKPDPNISLDYPDCSVCHEYFINLPIHKGKKHQIYSQSKIAIRARVMRSRRWLRAKLENIENEMSIL